MINSLCNGAYGYFDMYIDDGSRGQEGFYFQHYTEDDRFIINTLFTFISNKKISSSGDIIILENGELVVGEVISYHDRVCSSAQSIRYDRLNKYYLSLVADAITAEQWRLRIEKQKEALRRYISGAKTTSSSGEYTLHDVFSAVTSGDMHRDAPWLSGSVSLVDGAIRIEFLVRVGDVDYADDIASSDARKQAHAMNCQLELCRKSAWVAERGTYMTTRYSIKADDFITADTSTVWYRNVITVQLRSNLNKRDFDTLMARLDGLIHNKRRPKSGTRHMNRTGVKV